MSDKKYVDMLGFLDFQGRLPDVSDKSIEIILKTGLDLVHCTTAPPFAKDWTETLQYHNAFVGRLKQRPDIFKIVKTKDDLDDPRIKILCGLQHCPVSPSNIEGELCWLFEAGIRVMQVTYEKETQFCGSAEQNTGLTKAGYDLIQGMNRFGLIVDVSHGGDLAARQICDISGSVMASHTGCKSVYDHPRNLSDDALLSIANAGGIVGIFAVTFFLNEFNFEEFAIPSYWAADTVVWHIDYACNLLGSSYVVIGSDGVVKGYPNLKEWLEHFLWMKEKLDPDGKLGAFWPDQPLAMSGFYRMRTLEEYLEADFLDKDLIDGIVGGNALRFLRKNLPR